MSNTRDNLPSLQYWKTPPERVPQRFYVAFCLLMSSVQDAILGQKERNANNLNWSATCSYYSLVHGGRLLCFLTFGDVPKNHKELQKVFSANQPQPHPPRFNWLSRFSNRVGGQRPPKGSFWNRVGQTLNFRQMITDYLNQGHLVNPQEGTNKFGEVLAKAATLRDDSNYEELLIAHEYRHQSMSDAFDKLSLHMNSAAESTLPFLIDAFNSFRFHDPDLPKNRDLYEAFLHVYVQERIGMAIRRKLGGSIELERKLDDVLRRIGTRSIDAPFQQLEGPVSTALFEGKAKLMREFKSKIEALSIVTMS